MRNAPVCRPRHWGLLPFASDSLADPARRRPSRVNRVTRDGARPRRRSVGPGERDQEAAGRVGPAAWPRRSRPRPARLATPSGPELRRDLGPHLLARGELHVQVERSGRDPHRSRSPAAASRSTRAPASQSATCSNASGSKSAPSSRLITSQHVEVELGGHAGRVVVGGDQHVRVLDQVGAEQQPVARLAARRAARPGTRPARPAPGCRSCRRGTRPAGGRRPAARSSWRVKSPTMPVHRAARDSRRRSASADSPAAR